MKRSFNAHRTTTLGFTAALAAALLLPLAPNAAAHEGPEVQETVKAVAELAEGSSQDPHGDGEPDPIAILKTAVGVAKLASEVARQNPELAGAKDAGEVLTVIDPSIISKLAQAFAPAEATQLSPSMRGTTAEGYPVVFPTSGTLTSGYGLRWGAMHNGIDVANPVGTPIYSVMSGEVISSGPAQGFGHWIRIRHDNGAISVYGHMRRDSLLVNVGDRVEAGQQIATIGNEGHSTGPHLHFEIWPDGVSPSDPQQWFAQQGINF